MIGRPIRQNLSQPPPEETDLSGGGHFGALLLEGLRREPFEVEVLRGA